MFSENDHQSGVELSEVHMYEHTIGTYRNPGWENADLNLALDLNVVCVSFGTTQSHHSLAHSCHAVPFATVHPNYL